VIARGVMKGRWSEGEVISGTPHGTGLSVAGVCGAGKRRFPDERASRLARGRAVSGRCLIGDGMHTPLGNAHPPKSLEGNLGICLLVVGTQLRDKGETGHVPGLHCVKPRRSKIEWQVPVSSQSMESEAYN